MNQDIFREFSIRGLADRELTDDIVIRIGQAIGAFLKRQEKSTLVVGRDVRNSSPRISRALIGGLLQTGVQVTDIGQVPTPILNFTVDLQQADGGIMITASHNPAEYNGFKIRTDHILSGNELQEIYRIIQTEDFIPPVAAELSDRYVTSFDPLPDYLGQLKSLVQPLSFKVVVDGGNGTNGPIVCQLLRDLGCEVIELYCEPDGNFPNRNPDPTKSGAIADLSAMVCSEGADLGVAYDGDGDRLVLVDEQGNGVLGDQVLMILARDALRQDPAKIVYEILCTQALADDIKAHGGEPIMTPSGYAFVHRAMQDADVVLGGELSGHLFFREPGFRFDDAILGTVKLFSIVKRSQRPLSELVGELPAYFSSPELRIFCPDSVKGQVVEQVKVHYQHDYKVDTLDGARIHFDGGWALVRQSNTQPKISMRFEARTAKDMETIQSEVQPFVEAKIVELS